MTQSIEVALYFACNQNEEETGYVYKILGFDGSSISKTFDYIYIGDIINIDFNEVSLNLNILSKKKQNLFYRDINQYNLNSERQKGWHLLRFDNHKDDLELCIEYEIFPKEKKEIIQFLDKNKNINERFLFPINHEFIKEEKYN